MEIDRAVGLLVARRRCPIDEAFDEIVDASKRHRLTPLQIARALVVLAVGGGRDNVDAVPAARYEWGSLLEPEVVAK